MKNVLCLLLFISTAYAADDKMPRSFTYLDQVDPTIEQDIRYAGEHNIIGRAVNGYNKNTCILTKKAAKALKKVQKKLKDLHLALKVYDCYRPQRASQDFYQWSLDATQQDMKLEFYPRVNKKDFFKLEYVALYSGHTRGSTVDLTIIPLDAEAETEFKKDQALHACFNPKKQRYPDNSIDMGTGYDCLDQKAHYGADDISDEAKQNRKLLRALMKKYGFEPYEKEWWHFTLRNEPYKNRFYNFLVQ